MATFTAKDVKELRDKTGIGMMECKKALTEADGDINVAMEHLREKGLAAADKKAGRIAAEGMVHAVSDGNVAAIIEVNSETDFVAKNEEFRDFVNECALAVARQNPADVDALMNLTLSNGETIDANLKEKILKIGENIKIRRFERVEGVVATYNHAGGEIGVIVQFDTDLGDNDGFAQFAKDITLQIAASSPEYLDRSQVDPAFIESEKAVFLAQAVNEGKKPEIAERMVAGRINKLYTEVCLLEQPFVKDDKMNVEAYTSNTAKELGGNINITRFVCYKKGEGLEKRVDDFASEVAGMVK